MYESLSLNLTISIGEHNHHHYLLHIFYHTAYDNKELGGKRMRSGINMEKAYGGLFHGRIVKFFVVKL